MNIMKLAVAAYIEVSQLIFVLLLASLTSNCCIFYTWIRPAISSSTPGVFAMLFILVLWFYFIKFSIGSHIL